MKKEERSYHFRDKEMLLENIPKGRRSEFIREAIKTRLTIDDVAYIEEQETNQELLKFYQKQKTFYEEELERLEEQKYILKEMKMRTTRKINKQLKKQKELQSIIDTKRTLIEDNDIEKQRQEIAWTLIKNILYSKENSSVVPVNMDYLYHAGNYESKDEFKSYVQNYIKENLKPGTVIPKINKPITLEYIEYIKKQVNKRIKK